jgi:hypothetical protein
VEGILTGTLSDWSKAVSANWQSACYRASLKTFTQYRTTKRIKEQNQQTQTSKSYSISIPLFYAFQPYVNTPVNTTCYAEDSLCSKMKSK